MPRYQRGSDGQRGNVTLACEGGLSYGPQWRMGPSARFYLWEGVAEVSLTYFRAFYPRRRSVRGVTMGDSSFRRRVALASAGTLLLGLVLPVTAASGATSSKTTVTDVVAKTVRVLATQPWTDTGIHLSSGSSVGFVASGVINVSSGNPAFSNTPAGRGAADPKCIASSTTKWGGGWIAMGLPCWSLIGRIGNGSPFEVGVIAEHKVTKPGELYLGVNDQSTAFGDNSGSWTVKAVWSTPFSPSKSTVSKFVTWLFKCVEGQLSAVDPGCKDAAYELAGLRLTAASIAGCAKDIQKPWLLLSCIGEKGAYAIAQAWQWWMTHGKPGS